MAPANTRISAYHSSNCWIFASRGGQLSGPQLTLLALLASLDLSIDRRAACNVHFWAGHAHDPRHTGPYKESLSGFEHCTEGDLPLRP